MDAGRGTIFPMPQIPALFFPPPPPPPPPPLPSYSSSYSSSTAHHAPSITSFPILVLTVLGILTTSVLLLTYYVLVIRCCLNWHGSSDVAGLIARRGRRSRGGTATSSSSSSLPVSGTPAEARGLEESAIQALPAFRYRKAIKNAAADSAPTSECAVCLSEFEEEETVRMLPSCLHVFHVDCIDIWLQGNANCPLCRAAIIGNCLLPPLDRQPRRPEEVVIQVLPGTEEEEATQAQQQEASTAAAESAGDAAVTDQQVSCDKRRSSNAWRDIDISSKGDECIAERKDRDVLPLRRSFSMGSLGGGEVHLQIQDILQRNTSVHGRDSDSSSSSSSV